MATDSENIKGRAYAFGTLSAMKPLRRSMLELGLWIVRRVGAEHVLRELGFVHFAQWIVVPAQRISPEPGTRDALLFLGAFNGDRTELLQLGSTRFASALDLIWSHCESWPGARHWNALRSYADTHELFADVFFNAYGDADAHDVRAALRVTNALEQFALDLPAVDSHFRRRYERLLIELGGDLAA
jgi:hypothetical protein